MKRLALAIAAMCAFAPVIQAVDLTSYDKPRLPMGSTQFKSYRQILPQAISGSLTAVVTQLVGCSNAVTGGIAPVMTAGCGVYIDNLTVSCPTGSAGTVLVQDLQATPIALVPTISTAANTIYVLPFIWYWAPGGFKIQQVSGSGCTFYASWGVA